MLRSFRKIITTTEPEQLSTDQVFVSGDWIIQADSANAASIRLGDRRGQFYELAPGDVLGFSELGTKTDIPLSSDEIYILGSAGDMLNVLVA